MAAACPDRWCVTMPEQRPRVVEVGAPPAASGGDSSQRVVHWGSRLIVVPWWWWLLAVAKCLVHTARVLADGQT